MTFNIKTQEENIYKSIRLDIKTASRNDRAPSEEKSNDKIQTRYRGMCENSKSRHVNILEFKK